MITMKPFWSPDGQAALQRLAHSQPLLAFDFDGTLAPIVARPDDARVPLAISQRLAQLAERWPVAIITGRSIEDVQPRLGFQPHHLVGNHGAQTQLVTPDTPDTQDAPPSWSRTLLDPLRATLVHQAATLHAAGVQVEDKGLSLALHYRLAHDRAQALATIDQVLQPLADGLRRFGGKCVENIIPAAAPDKGDAVMTLLRSTGATALLFVGDDLNDEAVFERAQPDWLTIRIGNDAPSSRAKYFVGSQAELAPLLQHLHQLLIQQGGD